MVDTSSIGGRSGDRWFNNNRVCSLLSAVKSNEQEVDAEEVTNTGVSDDDLILLSDSSNVSQHFRLP